MKTPYFRKPETAVALGVAFFLAGWWCLYDAYDGRGRDTPKILRPFTWW